MVQRHAGGRSLPARFRGAPLFGVRGITTFATLAGLSVADEATFAALEVVGPELLRAHGLSGNHLVTTMPVAWLLGVTVGLMVLGPAGDRYNRVTLIQMTTLLFAAGTVLVANGHHVLLLVGGLFLIGLGSAGVKSAHVALLADRYPGHWRGRVLIGRVLLSNAGRGLFPLMLLGLVGTVTSGVLLLCLGGAAAALGCTAFLISDPERGGWELPGKTRVFGSPLPIEADHVSRRLHGVLTMRALSAALAGIGFVLYVLPGYRGAYALSAFEANLDHRMWNAAVTYAPTILVVPIVGWWFDKIFSADPRRVLMLASVVLVAVSAFVPLQFMTTSRFWFLIFGVSSQLLLGIVVGMLIPIVQAVVSPGSRSQGAAKPVLSSVLVGGLGGSVLAIPVVERFGVATALVVLAPPALLFGALHLFRASHFVFYDRERVARDVLNDFAADEARMADAESVPVIEVENVHFSYGHMKILNGVSFRVDKGETLALLGTNGAGKSTVLRVIAGLETPQRGAIRLNGRAVTFTSPRTRSEMGLQLMVGGKGVFASMSVRANLQLATRRYRSNPDDVGDRLNQVYRLFPELETQGSARASSLSGGEQQMLALAMALVHRPEVLIIDELSLGLAPALVECLVATIKELEQQGITVIIVEQSVDTACRVARRAIFMEKGSVRFDGDSRTLRNEREDLLRASFLRHAPELVAGPGLDLCGESPVVDLRIPVERP